MAGGTNTPEYFAGQVRRLLRDGGSARLASEVQHFFKEPVESRGWRTAELRKAAVGFRRGILKEHYLKGRGLKEQGLKEQGLKEQGLKEQGLNEHGMPFVVAVADELFSGPVLEEKIFAVFLLEGQTASLGRREFRRFASWLDRVTNWSDHDALVHDLLGPMVCGEPAYCVEVFRWARSRNRWRRRAACVALIRGARQKKFFVEIVRTSEMLLDDEDDMVQKGLGWLLREAAKYDARRTVPYLMKVRGRAPRLVLRTACETLPVAARRRVLG